MPWLLATALVQAAGGYREARVFKSWTLLLAIGGFSFSLLGAFLVRSGVLTLCMLLQWIGWRGLAALGVPGANHWRTAVALH